MSLDQSKLRESMPVIFLALLSVLMHLSSVQNLEYHRDELLYFSLGLHPSFGYNSLPPLIGWIAYFMQNVFGSSLFAVRLFPALLSGGMIFLAAAMAKELGGSRYSSLMSGFGLLISIFFMRSFFLYQPVHTEIFLWTLSIYFVIKYINTQKDKFLILFGIVAGLALLNKYLVGVLFAGLFIIIPFTEYRVIMRKKMFWIGLAVGFVIFLPNIIWQISKGFPVFNHISELYGRQLVHMDIPVFLTEQFIMPFAGTFFTIAGLIYLFTGEKIRKFRFLGFLSLFVIVGLMFMKGKGYYTLGIFPFLIVSGAVAYEHWFRAKWLRIIFPVILVVITIPVIPMGLPVSDLEGLKKYFNELNEKYHIDLGRRFEDGSVHSLPQDYADMLGWEELTSVTNDAYKLIDDKRAAFIYCENYGQAGAITVIGKKYGLPEPVSFSESFQYWVPLHFNPDITSLIYINNEPGEDVKAFFKKIIKVGSITNPDAREFGTSVYLCQEPVMSFNERWQERLQQFREMSSSGD